MNPKKLNLKDFRYYPVFLVLGLGLFFLIKLGALNPFISVAQNLTLPIQVGFYQSAKGISNIVATSIEIGGLRSKNSEITLENALLKAENAKLKKLEDENKSLRDQLGTPSKKLKIKQTASVIGNGGFGTKKVLLIDKGSQDNVKENDLVVVKDILIGKIINVSPKISSVQLLSDSDSSVPVVTAGGAEGILEGKFGSEISITNVLQSENLKEKEIVFTSGKDGLPRDLVVGEIGKVNKIEKEFFQNATVNQLVDPESLILVYLVSN